ncbi:CoA transferase [Halobacteriales archaeon QS_3_64_16]|nr:MAG: CoA transferase [Halobacteriales archaeon QS_3_64_16]
MTGNGPLAGLNVVEMTVHRAGPFCGALLADLGAEVVKIERPGAGDPARTQGPGPNGRSGYFMANNRNKRSVTVDLKTEAGTEAARSLLEEADVFVENFAYGVPEKLGIGYEAIRERNPGIIYGSVKGYGETGPAREKKGLDMILQAEGGIMSVTGPEGGSPVKVGQAIGDLTAGMQAAIGVLAKLHERGRIDGLGDTAGTAGETNAEPEEFVGKFDVGLFDAIVSLMNEYLTFYSMNGEVPGPQGVTHQSMVPYQLFETADGHVVTGVPSDDRWETFCDLLDREDLREYDTNEIRMTNFEDVTGAIQEEFAEESTDYWLSRLTEYGFPNGPLNDVADVVSHEQTAARDLTWSVDSDPDASGGNRGGTDEEDGDGLLLPGHPLHFPDYDPELRRLAPRLGEHTDDVFEGVAEQTTLDEWRGEGAFGDE